jgi:hypothetical protein
VLELLDQLHHVALQVGDVLAHGGSSSVGISCQQGLCDLPVFSEALTPALH